MGLLSRFEGKMEDTVEGAADRMAAAPLSPVQIAKKAEKQMRREKMVGAGKQYAPTLYTVLVNADDDRRLLGYYPTLAGETETYLSAKAAESGLVMDGQPLVRFIVDDDLRHAITKLSALHLTATEAYRRRVVQMGEQPERVVNTGAIGVWNIMNRSLLGRGELEAELGFSLEPPLAVVTYHPATLADSDPKECFRVLLEALDEHPGLRVLLTYPNNDAGADGLITMIEGYASARPGRVLAVPSLGALRYLSALQCASVVVGNSSSGIVEVPSTGTVTVDVGPRQQGRLCGPSVLHCAETREDISKAVATALGDEMQAVAARRENPYYKPDTLGIMTRSIATFLRDMPPHKHFFDI